MLWLFFTEIYYGFICGIYCGIHCVIIVFIPPLIERGLYCNHLVRPSVRLSVCSHFRNRYLSFYWKKWFYIWYMALAWWLVPCLPFPGLPHIYFLFTVRLSNERVGVSLARRSVQHLVYRDLLWFYLTILSVVGLMSYYGIHCVIIVFYRDLLWFYLTILPVVSPMV